MGASGAAGCGYFPIPVRVPRKPATDERRRNGPQPRLSRTCSPCLVPLSRRNRLAAPLPRRAAATLSQQRQEISVPVEDRQVPVERVPVEDRMANDQHFYAGGFRSLRGFTFRG